MSTVKISALTEKATMAGTEEVLINDSGVSKKFSTQRFLDVKTDCETAETNASASAVAAASSAASAASVYDSFDDRYLGNKASDPALDNDGDALVSGALYFNTTSGNMMVYDGSAWITTSSAVLSTLVLHKFTATAGQTIFTGTDDDGGTLSIKPTAEMVTLNGIVLESGADYTVTTTTLTLLTGATLNDEVNIYAFGNFELADHYNKATSDARYELIDTAYTKAEADAKYLLDSEVTNLAQVKAFSSSDYATASHNHTGTYEPADATIVKDADIGVTVQGYDANLVSDATYVKTDENFTTADHSKLDGIEAGATADQTQADINALGITATGLDLGNWTVEESAGVLYFKTLGVSKMKLDASGNLTVTGNITAYGTV